MVGPILEDLAKEYGGRVKIAKLKMHSERIISIVKRFLTFGDSLQLAGGSFNVDENPAMASQYGIRSIPTMLFLRMASWSIR